MTAQAQVKPGRPSKLTPDRIDRLTAALAGGHTRRSAAALAGIHPSTLHDWLAIAARPSARSEFVEFSDAVKSAELEAEDTFLAIIRNAAPKSWQAAA